MYIEKERKESEYQDGDILLDFDEGGEDSIAKKITASKRIETKL